MNTLIKILLYFALLVIVPNLSHAQNAADYNKWISKASKLYDSGEYKSSAEAYSLAFACYGGKAYTVDRYNAACSWSLAGIADSAFSHLFTLVAKANYSDYKGITTDKDFNNLHATEKWKQLCNTIKENKEKAEASLDKELVNTLEKVYESDQKYRQEIMTLYEKKDSDPVAIDAMWKKINKYDSINTIIVTGILEERGWPGPDVVGNDGCTTLFLVIQHADLKVQEKYLPMMRQAAKENKLNAAELALLEDRVALKHHKKQIYGSQITDLPKRKFLAPLIDPDHVDERRASVGLGPIADYLQRYDIKWDVEAYKKELPELEKIQAELYR